MKRRLRAGVYFAIIIYTCVLVAGFWSLVLAVVASYGSGSEEEGIADDDYGVHLVFVSASASALRRDQ